MNPNTSRIASGISKTAAAGFSLVEVTMAIGIVAFTFVAIFGLLPVGLGTFRSAMNASVQTQIVQRVVADAQQTDFDTLLNKPTENRYFDDEGNDLGYTPHPDAIYTVRVAVVSPTPLPTGTSKSSAEASDNLITLQISIANDPARREDPFAPEANVPVSRHAALIARNKHG